MKEFTVKAEGKEIAKIQLTDGDWDEFVIENFIAGLTAISNEGPFDISITDEEGNEPFKRYLEHQMS